MPLNSAGKTVVATAGTPVQIISSTTRCQSLNIQALTSNTQKLYVGNAATMNKATLAGVLVVLQPGASYTASAPSSQDPLDLSQIWLDADVNGEGVLSSYYVH